MKQKKTKPKKTKPKKIKMSKLQKSKNDVFSKYWRTKVLNEWGRQVRERAGNVCEICGSTKQLNSHHLLSKELFHQFYGELNNGVCLCVSCHKWGPASFHQSPVAAIYKLAGKQNKQLEWAVAHAYDKPLTMKEVDYQSIYESLTKIEEDKPTKT